MSDLTPIDLEGSIARLTESALGIIRERDRMEQALIHLSRVAELLLEGETNVFNAALRSLATKVKATADRALA
jgi:hypothetical protein